MGEQKKLDFALTGVLNKHSGLTTYHILSGDSISANAQKIVWKIFQNEQQILKSVFSDNFKSRISNIFYHETPEDLSEIFQNIYNNKKVDYSKLDVDYKALVKIMQDMIKDKLKRINELPLEDDSKKKLSIDLKESYCAKVFMSRNTKLSEELIEFKEYADSLDSNIGKTIKKSKTNLTVPKDYNFNVKQLTKVIDEIKDYCKEIAVNNSAVDRFLDLTKIARILNCNISRLKTELKDVGQTQLQFNYINKKKLDVDLQSSLISSVEVSTTKDKKQTWVKYEIPRRILELILNPEIYVPIDGVTISGLTDPNAILLYEFLSDHYKKKTVELTKEEIFGFIKCSKKCQNNRYEFVKRILAPSVAQINTNTDLIVDYVFDQEKGWNKITFSILRVEKSSNELPINKIELDTSTTSAPKKVNYKEYASVVAQVEKTKRNIYVARAWKKDGDRKVNQVLKAYGEDFTVFILKELYKNLNKEIEVTITAYINGIIKNHKESIKKKEKEEKDKLKAKPVKKSIIKEQKKAIETQEDIQTKEVFEYKSDVKLLDELIEEIENDLKTQRRIDKKTKITMQIYNELLARYRERKMDINLPFVTMRKFEIKE